LDHVACRTGSLCDCCRVVIAVAGRSHIWDPCASPIRTTDLIKPHLLQPPAQSR
jgi:hypothetical protein